MAGITERNQQKIELANSGFSMRYIDEWQPKTTLYRHKPSLSVGGAVNEEVGTSVIGVPGNPDYVLRKAKIGLFPWKPGVSCDCKWCKESYKEPEPEPEPELEPKDGYEGTHFTPDIICPFCHQNVKNHTKGCIGKRFSYTSNDKSENFERLRKLYKNR